MAYRNTGGDAIKRIEELRKRLETQLEEINRCKQVEQSLRESEEKYRFLVENSGDIIWKINPEGRWVFVSSNVERVTGYSVQEVLSRTVWDVVAPAYRPILKIKLKKRLEGEQIPPYEVVVIAKDGRKLPFEVVTSPVYDDQGRVIAIQGISRDITERKRAEEALKKSYAKLEERVEERTADLEKAMGTLRAILDTVPIGLILADSATGKISYYNQNAVQIMGSPITGTDKGPDVKSYQMLRPDGTPYLPDELPLPRSLRHGVRVSNQEITVLRADGTKVTVLASSAPVEDKAGHITAAACSLTDITRFKMAQEALKEAKAQAELYLDLMGHDINNLNQIAMGYLELACDTVRTEGKICEEHLTLLTKPLDAMKSSSQLIDNLRKIQQATGEEMKRERIDLGSLLESLVHEYSNVPGREVKIHYIPPRGYYVMANALLRDVFTNVIGNAIKHSTGVLTINITVDKTQKEGKQYYRTAVEDNGPGIPDELKSRLFSRSTRGYTKIPGRGLGLYLVRTLVEKFKGEVSVEDRVPGDYTKGARFIIMLPANH
jgi:PAS domain S-box-containing protein